jgi:hypothetical protein
LTWQPPERALRKLAHRQAVEQIFCPVPKWARPNWFRLTVALLENERLLLEELTSEEADEAIFHISCQVGFSSDWKLDGFPNGLLVRFVNACAALYESNQVFHPDGSAKFMLWDNLRLSYEDEPATGHLQDLLLEAMLRVLALDDREAKMAALHGLGHHKDERARPAIRALIDSTTDDELRKYALDAYDFRVL